MIPRSSRPTASLRRAGLAIGLVAALLFAQGLGLAHRIAHAPADAPAPAQAHPDRDQGAWSHDPGTAECRLLDLLSGADGLPTAVLELADAPAMPRQSLPVAQPCPSRRAHAQAQARAPPVTG